MSGASIETRGPYLKAQTGGSDEIPEAPDLEIGTAFPITNTHPKPSREGHPVQHGFRGSHLYPSVRRAGWPFGPGYRFEL
jgi:hypothetical protein